MADKNTPQPDTDETVFTKAVIALSNYFNPKQHVEFQQYVFWHMNQEKYELVVKYYAGLMQLTAMCNFTDTDAEIKSQLIAGSADEKTTRKGLTESDVSLDRLLQFVKTQELTDSQNRTVNKLHCTPAWHKRLPSRQQQKQIPPSRHCFNCGGN